MSTWNKYSFFLSWCFMSSESSHRNAFTSQVFLLGFCKEIFIDFKRDTSYVKLIGHKLKLPHHRHVSDYGLTRQPIFHTKPVDMKRTQLRALFKIPCSDHSALIAIKEAATEIVHSGAKRTHFFQIIVTSLFSI